MQTKEGQGSLVVTVMWVGHAIKKIIKNEKKIK
jgi:hypothetical protein